MTCGHDDHKKSDERQCHNKQEHPTKGRCGAWFGTFSAIRNVEIVAVDARGGHMPWPVRAYRNLQSGKAEHSRQETQK
jgi:hypothetical protein